MAGFGAPFRAQTNAQVTAGATPPSGNTQEAIWHQLYDTQLYTSGTTTSLNAFISTSTDPTLSNMTQGGTLPSPQTLQIYDITLDVLSILPVTLATTTVVGVLNDLSLLIFGSNQRPTWLLNISGKNYGPYSLTVLHGTGGPQGFGWSSNGTNLLQFARNEQGPGWNYYGRISILQQQNFSVSLAWSTAATMTENKQMRLSFFGVLNRRVL
jgi:hypothetical protein